MAKMNISFDTVEKSLSCTMDEANMDNVVGAYVYKSWDNTSAYRCELMMQEQDKANDTTKYTRIVASELATDKEKAECLEYSKLKGFLVISESSEVEKEVLEFFKSK